MLRVFSDVILKCENSEGVEFLGRGRNLGWVERLKGYVTEFDIEGVTAHSVFLSEKCSDETCPAPALRLEADKAFLEKWYGLLLLDIEISPEDPRSSEQKAN